MAPPSTKTLVTRENDQRKHQISTMVQTYKDILNRVLSILFRESNNADLTETDHLCNAQVSSEAYYRALKF